MQISARLSENIRTALISAGLFLALLLVTFSPVLFLDYTLLPTDLADTMTLPFAAESTPPHANNPLTTDGLLQFYPYKLMLRDAWQRGSLSFWNPLNAGGYPQYAETMGANFDPLNLIFLAVPLPMAFHLYVIAPLWIAGIAMYLFLRSYRLNVWVARAFATAYMFCGLFVTHLLPHSIPGAFCWLPLVCLFLREYLSSRRSRDLVAGAIVLALGFLGGNIQTSAFLAITVALYACSIPCGLSFARRISATLTIGLVAFCLTAIMWLPTLEFFFEVVKHGMLVSSSYARDYGILDRLASLPILATFFLPSLGGHPSGISLYRAINVYPIDFSAHLGFFPLLIAIWALVVFRKSTELRPFIVIALCGFLIPIATPLYHYLYHRFFIIGLFGLCAIGAIGMDKATRENDIRKRFDRFLQSSNKIFVAVAVIIVLSAVGVTIWRDGLIAYLNAHFTAKLQTTVFSEGNPGWALDRIRNTVDNYSLASPSLWITLITVTTGFIVLRRPSVSTTSKLRILWFITAIQSGWFAIWWLAPVSMQQHPLLPAARMTNVLAETSQRTVFLRRHDPNERYIFIDNENIAYHINAASIFESLIPRSYHLVFPPRLTDTSAPVNLLRRFDVRYVVTPRSARLPVSDFAVFDTNSVTIWKLRDTSYRAWLATRSLILKDDYLVLDSLEQRFDASAVYFSDTDALTITGAHDTSASALLVENKTESVGFQTNSTQPAYFVLSDTYYPGWVATVDGNDAKIYRCNYAMRAVMVPAGSHTVRFAFRPITFRIGVVVSSITLLALISLGIGSALWKIKIRRSHDLHTHL